MANGNPEEDLSPLDRLLLTREYELQLPGYHGLRKDDELVILRQLLHDACALFYTPEEVQIAIGLEEKIRQTLNKGQMPDMFASHRQILETYRAHFRRFAYCIGVSFPEFDAANAHKILAFHARARNAGHSRGFLVDEYSPDDGFMCIAFTTEDGAFTAECPPGTDIHRIAIAFLRDLLAEAEALEVRPRLALTAGLLFRGETFSWQIPERESGRAVSGTCSLLQNRCGHALKRNGFFESLTGENTDDRIPCHVTGSAWAWGADDVWGALQRAIVPMSEDGDGTHIWSSPTHPLPDTRFLSRSVLGSLGLAGDDCRPERTDLFGLAAVNVDVGGNTAASAQVPSYLGVFVDHVRTELEPVLGLGFYGSPWAGDGQTLVRPVDGITVNEQEAVRKALLRCLLRVLVRVHDACRSESFYLRIGVST